MNIHHYLIALLALLSVSVMPLTAHGDEATTGLSAQLATRLAEIREMEGTFEQTRHISVLSVPLSSSGQFTYQQGEGIVWSTLKPVESVVRISPEQGVMIVDGNGNPQPVPASEMIGGIFLGIFSGDLGGLNDYFSIEEQADGAAPEAGHWQLRLTPLQAGLAEHLEAIDIRGAELVEGISLLEANGDRTEIVFKAAKINGNIR